MRRRHNDGSVSETCHICGKNFTNSLALNSHVKYCENGGPTWKECDICNKFFACVKSHKEKVHVEQVPVVECSVCKKMVKAHYLKRHMELNHSAPDPKLKCTICDRQFKGTTSLKCHMAIHQGIRFQCYFCSETYGAKSNRSKHLLKKHPEEWAKYKADLEEKVRGQNPYAEGGAVSRGEEGKRIRKDLF